MSKIDLKLRYQQETGLGLEHINVILSREMDPDFIAYTEWLEDNIIRLQRGVDAWESANTIATAAHKAVNKSK